MSEILTPAGAGVILFISSLLQGTVGFGFGLLAIPLLLTLDLTLPQMVILVAIGSAVQRLSFAYQMRRFIDWPKLKSMIAVGIAALPLGLWVLSLVARQSTQVIQQFVGGLVLLAVLVQSSIRLEPRSFVPLYWGHCAAFCSGFFNGLANIGGPPIVLWAHAHAWTNEKMRVMPIAFTLPLIPFQFTLLYLNFGRTVLDAFWLGLALIPLVLLGNRAGIWLGSQVPVVGLRRIVRFLLAFMGLFYIFKPWIMRG